MTHKLPLLWPRTITLTELSKQLPCVPLSLPQLSLFAPLAAVLPDPLNLLVELDLRVEVLYLLQLVRVGLVDHVVPDTATKVNNQH